MNDIIAMWIGYAVMAAVGLTAALAVLIGCAVLNAYLFNYAFDRISAVVGQLKKGIEK